MHEKEVRELFERYGMQVGSCSYSDVSFQKSDSAFETVLTTVLPYWFRPESFHNISVYSMLPDYHMVLGKILEDISADLRRIFPYNTFSPHVDVSPVNEKRAAYLSGLGFIGKNTLLINENFGSFIFIGDICTDAEININNKIIKDGCEDCDLCIRACPGKALNSGFSSDRCVSAITQKKGELTDTEKSILRKSGYVWGCDVCSLVCPYNKRLDTSEYAIKYRDRLMDSITYEMLEGLSNGEFKRKFKDRAFSWKGVSTLRRNLEILECSE